MKQLMRMSCVRCSKYFCGMAERLVSSHCCQYASMGLALELLPTFAPPAVLRVHADSRLAFDWDDIAGNSNRSLAGIAKF
jgi:hypothetical protein